MSDDVAISIQGVRKSFGDVHAVDEHLARHRARASS